MDMSQTLAINLEILPEDEHDADPAAVNTFASTAINTLQQDRDRYLIKPLSTGQRGGLSLLFQIIIQGIQTIDSALLAQKDSIDVLSGLCTIFTTASASILVLFKANKKQSHQDEKHTITVKMKIDNAEIEVTSADIANDERIVQLAERFHQQHPQIKPTSKSNITIQARVPKQRSRPRR